MEQKNKIEEALKASMRSKKTKEDETKSVEWLRQKARVAAKENQARRKKRRDKLLGDESRIVASFQSGAMYLFSYDAKYKDTLPYWDLNPLIFPIEVTATTILGLNLHYLQPMLRAKLLDAILDLPRYKTEQQRAKISYDIIKSVSGFHLAAPTIHKYLSTHIRGNMIEIPREEWNYVGFLPLANFKSLTGSASLSRVYSDSRKKI